jgi:hypothetical protein
MFSSTGRPEVRFRGQTGNILLILNITGFDLAFFNSRGMPDSG